jgi:hypothetical protein
MRDNPAYQDILVAIQTGDRSRTAWYGFGSFFRESHLFSDIDLLAVCADVEGASAIRQELETLCNEWPIHLLIMTESEAEETNFIQSQRCIPLLKAESQR